MEGPTFGMKKRLKECQARTENLLHDIEDSLNDFEKTKDPQQLYEKTKQAIKRFSDA